jgi:threonine synthase
MADTNSALTHFEDVFSGDTYETDFTGFPVEDQILDPQYDYDSVDITRADWEQRHGSMWKYRELLPITDTDHIVSLGEGETPLISADRLAEQAGVDRLLLKDEGQNPTNTFKDRGASASISGAVQQGIDEVALATAGNAGQAASAYAARAGLDCHVFMNHQAGNIQKQMTDAHGANLHLVDGKLPEAGAAFMEDLEANDRYSVATFHTPFRHEGKKTMGFELFEQLDWTTPDHVVYPTGGGVGLVGIWKAYEELCELGWLDEDAMPALHVAQSSGNAPIVRALDEKTDAHTVWENPNSIARGVEVPDPGASPWLIDIVTESGGTGVQVSDETAIEVARDSARLAGVEVCVNPGVALAGAMKLGADGVFDESDEVVVLNTGAGCKTAHHLSSL